MQPTVWKPGVEKNTDIGRAKARALIQIYDAIVKSGVKWAKGQTPRMGQVASHCGGPGRRKRRLLDRDGVEPQQG